MIVKYGVVIEDFEREYISSKTLYTVYHYEGQILISDTTWSKWIDDFTVNLLKTNAKALGLVIEQFEEEKSMHDSFAKQFLDIGEVYCFDNLTWMTNMSRYPIRWFDSLEEALREHKEVPLNRKVSQSSPVNTN
ncbi:hypothetical protein EM89_020320 [Vibrio parahaemolyticus]|nr:hypothetical protein [Vibrio parahaemolyticus]OQS72925.1 hypothetical protein EM89_020320 [Vibrio parahaemolyticus]OQS98391.1 hypothetical protein EN04_014130 [Vibrio parahaemolyticus O4:K12 str. K1203]PNO27996.1 hypothetical protein RK53_005055 [Vibrio parahaemolyticus]